MSHYSKMAVFICIALLSIIRADEKPDRRGIDLFGSMYADLGLYHYILSKERDTLDFSGADVFALRFRNANRENAKIEGDFEVILPTGAAAENYTASVQYGETDTTTEGAEQTASGYFELFNIGNAPVLLDMRKFYLELYLPFVDIAFGRQIINFGNGTVFSPIDAFSSVQFGDIRLRRRGSDVAYLRFPIGGLAGVDCIVEAPYQEREHSSAVKLFATLAEWDLSLIGIYRHQSGEVMTGLAFKGDAVVGIYGEFVEHFINGIDKQYFEFMLGTDYSVRNIWFFDIEYYYKGRSPDLQSIWDRNNAYFSVRYSPYELMQFALSGIFQMEERRVIGTLSWYYSLFQNTDLTLYVRGYNNMGSLGMPDLHYAARIEVKF